MTGVVLSTGAPSSVPQAATSLSEAEVIVAAWGIGTPMKRKACVYPFPTLAVNVVSPTTPAADSSASSALALTDWLGCSARIWILTARTFDASLPAVTLYVKRSVPK